jgi:hypothetical protein
MSHFAKLDENNVVLEVQVVHDPDISSEEEQDSHGIAFLTELSGGHTNWKRTSPTGSLRKNYAVVGGTYDPTHDAFISPKPLPSMVLDETFNWIYPIPAPKDNKVYNWDEATISWILQPPDPAITPLVYLGKVNYGEEPSQELLEQLKG